MQRHFREIVNIIFGQKSRNKNRNVTFDPSTKRRRDLKIFSSGVIFHGRPANGIQNIPAPQKQTVFNVSLFHNFVM